MLRTQWYMQWYQVDTAQQGGLCMWYSMAMVIIVIVLASGNHPS